MHILYICRLFTGFEDSLNTGEWDPKGAPTVARMIEALDKSEDHNITLTLTCKDFNSGWSEKKDRLIAMTGLNTPAHVLAGKNAFPKWLWKFQEKFSDLRQCWKLWKLYRETKPDMIYCDRVNIFPAAFFARFTNTPVVWRVMGVLQFMHQGSKQSGPRARFQKHLWHSPFAAVICSLDGSGGSPWLKRVLNPNTQRMMLVNGFDAEMEEKPVDLPETKKTRILFAGRVEHLKGLTQLVDAAEKLNETASGKFEIIVAGDGSALDWLKDQVTENNLQQLFSFKGAMHPAELRHLRKNCDIYVSLNTHGNMTNTVIEALNDGICTLIPEPNPETGVDVDTNEFLPADAAVRFGQQEDTDALAATLLDLHNTPEKRKKIAAAGQKFASENITSWDARIDNEIKILQKLYDENTSDTAIVISDLGAGGAQKIALSLARHWRDQGQKVCLITWSDPADDFHTIPDGVKRLSLDAVSQSGNLLTGVFANIGRIMKLRSALKNTRAKNIVSFIAPTNILTVLATRFMKAHVVISERNDPAQQSFGGFWDFLRKIFYRRANVVTANSRNAVSWLKDYVPEKKLKYVPNNLTPPDPQYVTAPAKKQKLLLTVGRLHPQKGHETLLRAFQLFLREHPDWKMEIVGDGQLRDQLEKRSESLRLEDHVSFTGRVANPYEYYARAPVFVLPSHYEGMPNALLEAMSCGLAPIVSNTCTGALSFIKPEQSGLVFKSGDSRDLFEKMARLAADPKLMSTLSEGAKDAVEPAYDDNIFQFWDDLLAETKS